MQKGCGRALPAVGVAARSSGRTGKSDSVVAVGVGVVVGGGVGFEEASGAMDAQLSLSLSPSVPLSLSVMEAMIRRSWWHTTPGIHQQAAYSEAANSGGSGKR
jgi:hypothetical protein